MENCDSERKSPISEKIFEMGLKNVHEVGSNNEESITFSTFPSIKEDVCETFGNNTTLEFNKTEKDHLDDAFMEHRTFEDCKLKTKEEDINEKELEQTETRMMAYCIGQEEQKDQIFKNKEKEFDDQAELFKCDQCDYQSYRKDYMKVHLHKHKSPEDYYYA